MKTLISLFSIVLCLSYGKAQWVELDPGVDETLFDIYAITPDIAVAVGLNGTIIKTTDGGETWQQKDSGTTKILRKIQFLTLEIGYVIGDSGVLLKTADNGETWHIIETDQSANFEGLSIVNENLFYIIYSHYLLKTEDGGNSWNNYVLNFYTYNEIQFFDTQKGFLSSSSGIMTTEDGGVNWQELGGVIPFQFIDENTGFFYADGLYKTIDGGYNFELLGYGQGQVFSNIYVVDENNTWGTINGLLNGDPTTQGIVKVHILSDGTYTEDIWYDNDPEIDMASIHFADNTGYIVGYKYGNPTIWKNGTGINTMSAVEPTINEIKVYPNPASNVINIDLGKTVSDFNISLTDLSGKQLISQNYKSKNKISVNTEKLSKGVYILSIQTDRQKLNRKIIIR